MSVWIDPDNLTLISDGILVTRTAALPGDNGEHDALFSVDGGLVKIVAFGGYVTAAIPAQSIDFDLHFDPDDGGSDVALATALIADSDPVGTHYTLNPTFGGALIEELDVADGFYLATPYVVPAGNIVLGTTGGGAIGTTARIEWRIIYLPIDSGATVTALASAPA